MNVHGNVGRVLACASTVPTSRDVEMHAGILHHAVAGANPLADIRAERLFFELGHPQLANVIRLLGDAEPLVDATDLLCGDRRANDGCLDQGWNQDDQ